MHLCTTAVAATLSLLFSTQVLAGPSAAEAIPTYEELSFTKQFPAAESFPFEAGTKLDVPLTMSDLDPAALKLPAKLQAMIWSTEFLEDFTICPENSQADAQDDSCLLTFNRAGLFFYYPTDGDSKTQKTFVCYNSSGKLDEAVSFDLERGSGWRLLTGSGDISLYTFENFACRSFASYWLSSFDLKELKLFKSFPKQKQELFYRPEDSGLKLVHKRNLQRHPEAADRYEDITHDLTRPEQALKFLTKLGITDCVSAEVWTYFDDGSIKVYRRIPDLAVNKVYVENYFQGSGKLQAQFEANQAGQLIGSVLNYDKNGEITVDLNYSSGKANGWCTMVLPKWELSGKANIVDNYAHGSVDMYHHDTKVQKNLYEFGQLRSITVFDPQGQEQALFTYIRGTRDDKKEAVESAKCLVNDHRLTEAELDIWYKEHKLSCPSV